MKTLFALAFLGLPLGAQTPTQEPDKPVVVRQDGMLELKFDETGEGLTLEAFIKICQEQTGQNFTFADDAKGNLSKKIRIFGKKVIDKSRFYSFFQTVMKINDFVCAEFGKGSEKVIVILDLKSQPQNKTTAAANAVFLSDPAQIVEYSSQPGVLVATVFPLRYQDPNRLQASLRQYMTDQQMEKIFNVGSSGILIQSFGPTVYAIKKLLDLIDVPPDKAEPPVMEIIPLEFAAAEEIEPILSQLIEKRRGRAGGVPRPAEGLTAPIQPEDEYDIKVIPDPRTNSLIVQAAKSDLVWVLDIIQRLDTKLDAPESNFHIYNVKNVAATKLAENLSKFLEQTQQAVQQAQQASAGRAGGAPAASPKEQKPVVIADEDTNSILVTASKTRWTEIKNLIERLDIRQQQVLIETALVELTVGDDFNIGVEIAKLSGSSLPEKGDPAKPGALTSFGLSQFEEDPLTGFPTGRTIVSSGALTSGQGLLAGYITGDDIKLPVLLAALKTRNNANILSIPSVLVTNNYNALIDSHTTIQTTTSTVAGTGQSQTSAGPSVDAGITLNISPSISAADYLRLNIDLKVSSFTGSAPNPNVAPPTTTRLMKTSVYVPDGSTLYIGGIVVDDSREGSSGVPILMDIPIIGQLFRSDTASNNKTTLYFFITPRIIQEEDFSDLVEISYRRKLEANTIIGSEKILRIDPTFTPLAAPGEGTDMKKLESSLFEVPVYRSPSPKGNEKAEGEKNPK